MMLKKYGRVGDSPIIGAGTYANNEYAAISCTGHGEFFMKTLAAYDVVALMQYLNLPLEEATHKVIFEKLLPIGGFGGLIAVDKNGNISMPFNTPGMFRGSVSDQKEIEVFVFGN